MLECLALTAAVSIPLKAPGHPLRALVPGVGGCGRCGSLGCSGPGALPVACSQASAAVSVVLSILGVPAAWSDVGSGSVKGTRGSRGCLPLLSPARNGANAYLHPFMRSWLSCHRGCGGTLRQPGQVTSFNAAKGNLHTPGTLLCLLSSLDQLSLVPVVLVQAGHRAGNAAVGGSAGIEDDEDGTKSKA